MRIFGTDLDGCVSDIQRALDYEVRAKFKVGDVVSPDEYYPYRKYGVEEEAGYAHHRSLIDDLRFWNDAKPIAGNIAEISRWTLSGMVPSIITGRDLPNRVITEFWLAQHKVGYSNLAMGVKDDMKGLFAKHLDLSFYIEDKPAAAFNVASYGIKVYVIRHPYNSWMENDLEFDSGAKFGVDAKLITFVDDFADIARIEKI